MIQVTMIQTNQKNYGHKIRCDENNTAFWEAEGYKLESQNGKRTIVGWTYLARCSLYNIKSEQAEEIGKLCFEAEAKNENYSVWHQSAIYFRNGKNCNCAKCHPIKSAFKYHHVG